MKNKKDILDCRNYSESRDYLRYLSYGDLRDIETDMWWYPTGYYDFQKLALEDEFLDRFYNPEIYNDILREKK